MPAQGTDIFAIERGGSLHKLSLSELGALLSGGVSVGTAEVDLGPAARRSGSFSISGSGLAPGSPVLIQKAVGPYTGKGTRADEAEMDAITASGVVEAPTLIRVYWQASGPVRGNVKFNYMIGV